MFKQQYLFTLAGLLLLVIAVMSCRDKGNPRRWFTGLFWGLYGLIFLVDDWAIPLLEPIAPLGSTGARTLHVGVGMVVVVMALIAGFGGVRLGRYHARSDAQRQQSARTLKNRLFIPTLMIPVMTAGGVVAFTYVPGLQRAVFGEGNHSTLITLTSMTLGCLLGWLIALRMTHEKPQQSLQEARRLLDSIGWAFILPQILATLGLVFVAAGIDTDIAYLTQHYLALDSRFAMVALYAVAMALLSMIMGNAFAAFPIATAGIGLPILVGHYGGDPAVMAAIGMFCGYCGTLMTPMAANYNIVPAALLELPDRNGVIKAQLPTGIVLLGVNILLLYYLMFL